MSSSDSQLHHELHQHLNHGRHGGEADNTENTNGMEDSHDTADYNSQGQMLTQDEGKKYKISRLCYFVLYCDRFGYKFKLS